jgi:hypothetical protein
VLITILAVLAAWTTVAALVGVTLGRMMAWPAEEPIDIVLVGGPPWRPV